MNGQLAREEKTKRIKEWKDTSGAVLVATCAAQGVEAILTLFDPEDTNVLVQMVGRGGRNGGETHLYYCH